MTHRPLIAGTHGVAGLLVFVMWGGMGVGASLTGCAGDAGKGYSFSPTVAGHGETISVDIFDNYTFSKGAEVELTEAIIKEVQRATPLRVTTGQADTTLSGVVRVLDLKRVARDTQTGLADQIAVKLTVDFEWKDSRTGAVIVGRKNFSAVDTFVAGLGTGEPIELGRRTASQRLARDLVAELRSAW